MNQESTEQSSEPQEHPQLPNGDKFRADTLVEKEGGLRFYIKGLMAAENDQVMVIMEPETPDPDDPGTPQGELLGLMGDWKVITF